MPNITNGQYSNASYSLVKHVQKPEKASATLPPSSGESVKPDFLIHHENHFDRNSYTPEQSGSRNPDPIKSA